MPSRRSLALIATISVTTLAVACGGGGDQQGPTEPTEPPSQVTTVTVSPSSSSLNALGATQKFEATARDQSGNRMPGVSFSWSSSDQSVASVDGSGRATAEGNGTVQITAESSGVQGSAELTVDQKAASLSVSPGSAELKQVGDTNTFSAEATDPNGRLIADLDVSWTTSDRNLAKVDSEGLVTGLRSGKVTVIASADGQEDSAPVSITTGQPVVQSVDPATLEEDSTAVLRGERFSPTMSTVTVDGREVDVERASLGQIHMSVPSYNCLPARRVVIKLSVPRQTPAEVESSLTPKKQPVKLEAGNQKILEKPGEFCLQFKETSASEAYLVGVQNTSEVASDLTAVRMVSKTAGQPSADLPAGFKSKHQNRQSSKTRPSIPSRWQRHLRSELRFRRRQHESWTQSQASTGSGASAKGSLLGSSVDSTVSKGDTVVLRVPQFSEVSSADKLCSTFNRIEAKVEAVGDHGLFVADLENPPNGYTDQNYQDLSNYFDSLNPIQTTWFGEGSDIDNNDRTVLFVTKEVNKTGKFLGLVWPGDWSPQSRCAASDVGELTYLKAPDPNGAFGKPYTRSAALSDALTLLPHEYTHVLQNGGRLPDGMKPQVPWIAEGQSMIAEEVIGHVSEERSTRNNYGFNIAFDPDNGDFTKWYKSAFIRLGYYLGKSLDAGRNDAAPEKCTFLVPPDRSPGACDGPIVYGASWSFLRWLSDHFGDQFADGEATLHQRLVKNQKRGFGKVESVVGTDIDRLLGQWAASLWIDGRVPAESRLRMLSWNLFDIYERNLPVEWELHPALATFSNFSTRTSVRAASTAYYLVGGESRPATAIRFRTPSGAQLNGNMQIWIVRAK